MIEGRRLALLVGAMLALILIRCLIASLPYSGPSPPKTFHVKHIIRFKT